MEAIQPVIEEESTPTLVLDEGYNPYSPPAPPTIDVPPTGGRAATSGPLSGFVWTFLALHLLAVVMDGATLAATGKALVGPLVRAAAMPVGLYWLAVVWERLPPLYRHIGGKERSAGAVVGRVFIPFYGIYWMFVAHAALCTALDTRLVLKGREGAAPRGLAFAGCALTVCGNLVAFTGEAPLAVHGAVTGAVWFAYMVGIERVFRVAFRRKGRR